MKTINTLAILLFTLVFVSSCEKDPIIEQIHIDLDLMDAWQDFEINENEEIIMKISLSTETKLDLSWKEEAFKKDIDTYNSDILVSAYRPDGTTPYFENEDNGFQEESELINIVEGDNQVILIITAHEGKSGSFGIRVRGINELEVTNPKDIAFGTDWIDKNINVGDVKWLKVNCGSEINVAVEWMEFDRPELSSTYTADIQVSVFSEDLDVVYVDQKNHGFDDSTRTFTLSHSSSIIYIRVTLYDSNMPGTYAIRAYVPQLK